VPVRRGNLPGAAADAAEAPAFFAERWIAQATVAPLTGAVPSLDVVEVDERSKAVQLWLVEPAVASRQHRRGPGQHRQDGTAQIHRKSLGLRARAETSRAVKRA